MSEARKKKKTPRCNGTLIYSSSVPSKVSSDVRSECRLKVLVIGEPYAGKTSFITRYVNHQFNTTYRATVGVDFALKVVEWRNRSKVRLQLWDIAGQERFADMTRVFYKDGLGACIIFDVSKPLQFDAVIKWKTDLDQKVTLPDGSPVPCILIANKSDLLLGEDDPNGDILTRFCEKHNFVRWFLTSAKTNSNVEESMNCLIDEMMRHCQPSVQKATEEVDDIDVLNNNNPIIKLNGQPLQKEQTVNRCIC